ncbi:hypothetical protein BOX15_Mlig016617g2, partial [Macrostomum lignano]
GGNKKKSTKAAPAKPLAASTAGDEAAAPADAAARWYRDPLTKAALKPSEPSEPGGKTEFARKKGGEALAQLAKAFRSDMQTSRSFADRFAIRVLESGTQADRVGVMTGLVRDHPLESLAHLEALVAMVTPKAKRDALTVLDAVKSLFLEHLLPPGRRLVPLDRRPFTRLAPVLARKGRDAARHVRALWYFEERLGQLLQQFLDRLDGLLRDPVDAARLRAVAAVAELAVGHRDCRSRAMASLANKLGDPSRRVCGAALHRLRLLAVKRPEMKAALVDEIERLLFRGNADSAAARGVNSGVARTHRYAVCLLCQLPLTAADTNAGGVAGRLAGIYLAFFKAAAKRQEVAGRLFAGLLTGLHRALPFCGPDKLAELSEHARLLFGLVHLAGFNVGVQCLLVLFQLVQRDPSLSDRFYRALYQRLLDIGPVAKRAMLMHLLYRSLSWDSRLPRVRAFVRRILQVATMQDSAFACASLLLIGQLEGDRPGLVTDMLSGGAAPATADATTGTPMAAAAAAAAASYDPLSRQPEFCGAEAEPLWELPHYLSHCHPSVRLFASQIIAKQPIVYDGDPLADFSLAKFLERFSFKNPKKAPPPGDPSARFRPRRRSSSAAGAKLAPSREELARIPDEASVAPTERHLHRYLRIVGEGRRPPDDFDSDASSVGDEEFDDFLEDFEQGLSGDAEAADFADDFGRADAERRKKSAKQSTKQKAAGQDGDDSVDDDVGESDGEDDIDMLDDEELSDLGMSSDGEDYEVSGGNREENGDVDIDAEGFAEMLEGDSADQAKAAKRAHWDRVRSDRIDRRAGPPKSRKRRETGGGGGGGGSRAKKRARTGR